MEKSCGSVPRARELHEEDAMVKELSVLEVTAGRMRRQRACLASGGTAKAVWALEATSENMCCLGRGRSKGHADTGSDSGKVVLQQSDS